MIRLLLLPGLLLAAGAVLLYGTPAHWWFPWLPHAVVGASMGAAAQVAYSCFVPLPELIHVHSEDHHHPGQK